LLHGPDKDVILITEGLRIKEIKEVFEGEVTELTPVETEDFVRVFSFLVS
jgi:DNA helicase TIP49 (TBP-interacting protein)